MECKTFQPFRFSNASEGLACPRHCFFLLGLFFSLFPFLLSPPFLMYVFLHECLVRRKADVAGAQWVRGEEGTRIKKLLCGESHHREAYNALIPAPFFNMHRLPRTAELLKRNLPTRHMYRCGRDSRVQWAIEPGQFVVGVCGRRRGRVTKRCHDEWESYKEAEGHVQHLALLLLCRGEYSCSCTGRGYGNGRAGGCGSTSDGDGLPGVTALVVAEKAAASR